MTSNQLKLLIVDSNELIAYGCEALIKRSKSFKPTAVVCKDIDELLNAINIFSPDVLLVSPIIAGAKIDSRIADKCNGNIAALLYTTLRGVNLLGYKETITINDSAEEIIQAIERTCHGDEEDDEKLDENILSPRETDVVALVAKGMTNKEIAISLDISIHTVITHRRNIAKKLDIHSASGLTIYAIMRKLVKVEETSMR